MNLIILLRNSSTEFTHVKHTLPLAQLFHLQKCMFHKHSLFYLSPCFCNVNYSYLIHKGEDAKHRSCVDLYIIFPGKGSRESKRKLQP